jgi:hypothetical protein
MSQIINQLATIEINNEVLQQLDLGGIYESFSRNYKKLDDLKNFRTDYEKKNRLMRWWHNDKLRDAQLDSSEVQAEFSKTIGQLMMISILQSRKLSEGQTQLNDQQRELNIQTDRIEKNTEQLQLQSALLENQSSELKEQADSIEGQTVELQHQHARLEEQSESLKKLMDDYFALQGLTEEGALKLISIGNEVKTTKENLLQEFASRSETFESLCRDLRTKMVSLSVQVGERIQASEEQTSVELNSIKNEARKASDATEVKLEAHKATTQNALNQCMEKLVQGQLATEAQLQEKHDVLSNGIESLSKNVATNIASVSAQLTEQMRLSAEQTQAGIAGVQRETREALSVHEESLRDHQEKLRVIDDSVKGLTAQSIDLTSTVADTKGGLSHFVEQQTAHWDTMAGFQQEVSKSLKLLRYVAATLSVSMLCMLGFAAHLVKWI